MPRIAAECHGRRNSSLRVDYYQRSTCGMHNLGIFDRLLCLHANDGDDIF
jgi:hypothetical protein